MPLEPPRPCQLCDAPQSRKCRMQTAPGVMHCFWLCVDCTEKARGAAEQVIKALLP